MNKTINKYFNQYVKKVGFLELRKGTSMRIGNLEISDDIPLPVIEKNIYDGVKKEVAGKSKDKLEDTIDSNYIIEGIVSLLGTDRNFKHNKLYLDILKEQGDNIKEYILYLAMKDLEEEKNVDAAIKFRTILLLDEDHVKANFNYALTLESIGMQKLDKEDKNAKVFIDESTRIFEELLNIDPEFSYPYYKLGYHYKNEGQFLKAKLIWEKFLERSEEDLLKQNVREEIETIEDDANMETGLTYLMYEDYDKALESFMKLLPKYEDQWNVNMLIGRAHSGLGEYKLAEDYYKKSIENSKGISDPYNELAILYFNREDYMSAIKILNQGIENVEKDHKLYFNRALAAIQINNIQSAMEDLTTVESMDIEDKELLLTIEDIKRDLQSGLI